MRVCPLSECPFTGGFTVSDITVYPLPNHVGAHEWLVIPYSDRNYTLSHYRIVFTAISSVCSLIILLNFMHSKVASSREDGPSSI